MRTIHTPLCSAALLCAVVTASVHAADLYPLGGPRTLPYAAHSVNDNGTGLKASWGFEVSPLAMAAGTQVSALGFYQLSSGVAVFGKAGVTLNPGNALVPALGLKLAGWEDKSSVGYGLGLRYQISERWSLRTDWDRSLTDINLLSVGLQSRF